MTMKGFFKKAFKKSSKKKGESSKKSLKDDMSLGGTVSTDCDTKCTGTTSTSNVTEPTTSSDSGHEDTATKIITEGENNENNKKNDQRFRFSRPMKKTNFFEPHHCIVPADTLYYNMDELQDKMKSDVAMIDKEGQEAVESDDFSCRGLEYHLEQNAAGRGKSLLYQKMVLQKVWSLTRSAKALKSHSMLDKIPDRIATFATGASAPTLEAAQEQAARDAEEAQRIYQEDESYLHLMPVEGEEYAPTDYSSSTSNGKAGSMPPKVLWMIAEDEGGENKPSYDEPSELDFSSIEQQ